ncbi:MAG: hypothetical protein QOC64_3783 [Solirubrobacteraceae bacterium]|nr:hypothetical protein [Solirubrobacteraceae bacterium]
MDARLRRLLGPGPRGGPVTIDPAAVLARAARGGVPVGLDDLRALLAIAGRESMAVAPAFIAGFIAECADVRRAGRGGVILDLWAAAGWMLPRLAAALRPDRAIGVLPGGDGRDLAPFLDPAGRVEWREETDVREAVARIAPGSLDLVVGCPPWHWGPRHLTVATTSGPVALTEDPANVALLEACAEGLTPAGIGLFVVGPGFLMRPGPGTAVANLARFGLAVELLASLPRGIYRPDSGSGRLLIGIGRRPRGDVAAPTPVVGALTPAGSGELLDAVRRSLGRR